MTGYNHQIVVSTDNSGPVKCETDRRADASPRWNISEPFNFQHLTHTTPQHVQKIQINNHDDLVSEFSAIRAAQAPRRELRGIKAVNIQQGVYFSESSASETSSPPQTGYSSSPPRSPARDHNRRKHCLYNPPSPVRPLVHKRSIENFSQPSPGYHTAQTSPISPPPRTSSRHFAPNFLTFHQEPSSEAPPESHTTAEGSEPLDHPISTWDDGAYDLSMPHAVTTPDDTAHLIRPPPFSMVRTELAGVPEEDEMSEGKRCSITTSMVRPTTPSSSLRHAKSFPSNKSPPNRWSGVLPQTGDEEEWLPRQSIKSVSFATPCWEEHKEEVPVRPRTSRRISLRKEESWEDVIDYCYEHEAEADCNFDWDLASTHPTAAEKTAGASNEIFPESTSEALTVKPTNIDVSPARCVTPPRPSSSTYSCSPPSLLPLQTFLPDLVSPTATSVESSFSSIPEVTTPLPIESTFPTKTSVPTSEGWPAPTTASPMIVLDDSRRESVFDDLYRDMLASHASSEQQLPFNIGRVDGSTIDNSPRSSRSPISKSSSQESFWYSQANVAARRQRNSGSVGSLPELVQSRSNERCETNGTQLTDQLNALSTSDAPTDGLQRRRSTSLAKEAAMKSMLAKVAPSEEKNVPEVPLPLHPAFRDRASSDAVLHNLDTSMPLPPQPNFARRMRSTSSASSLASRKVNRGSYSLFPPPTIR